MRTLAVHAAASAIARSVCSTTKGWPMSADRSTVRERWIVTPKRCSSDPISRKRSGVFRRTVAHCDGEPRMQDLHETRDQRR